MVHTADELGSGSPITPLFSDYPVKQAVASPAHSDPYYVDGRHPTSDSLNLLFKSTSADAAVPEEISIVLGGAHPMPPQRQPSHGTPISRPKRFLEDTCSSPGSSVLVPTPSSPVTAQVPMSMFQQIELVISELSYSSKLLICIGGIYVFFLLQSISQQKMYQIKAVDTQFSFTFTLMASVTLTACILANVVFRLSSHNRCIKVQPASLFHAAHTSFTLWSSTDTKEHSRRDIIMQKLKELWSDRMAVDIILCASSFVVAKFTGWHALTLVDFPSQALSKCAKPVAVFIVAFFTKTQKYSFRQIVIVLWIVSSLFTFNMTKPYESHADVKSVIIGNMLLLVSLMCEGYTADRQDKLALIHQMSGLQMMEQINRSAALFVLPMAVVLELRGFIAFCWRFPQVIPLTVIFAATSAVGQVFLYASISTIGALQTSLVTTSRKLLTVLVSVVLFDKSLLPLQWAALCSVFAAVLTKTYLTFCKSRDVGNTGFGSRLMNMLPSSLRKKQKYHDEDQIEESDLDTDGVGGERRLSAELPLPC